MIAGVLKAWGRPYIVGGDWNFDPDVMVQSGWPQFLGATVVSAHGNTYESGDSKSSIDWFLVENFRMSCFKRCYTIDDTSVKKHKVVILELKGEVRARKVWRLKRPPRLPPDPPRCQVRLKPPCWEGYLDHARATRTQDDLDDLYDVYQRKAVPELLSNLQAEDVASVEQVMAPPSFVKTSALRHCAGYLLKPNHVATWRHLETKRKLLIGYKRSQNVRGDKDMCVYLMKFTPNHEAMTHWDDWRFCSKRLVCLSLESTRGVRDWCRGKAEMLEEAGTVAKYKAWKDFVVNEISVNGQSRIHRHLKGPVPWTAFDVQVSDGGPQENADTRAAKWHRTWGVGAVVPAPPWQRNVDLPLQGVLEDIQMARDLSLKYKRGTAVGGDLVHPRHFGHLPDQTLGALLMIARVMLMLGVLPRRLDWLRIALVPKAEGGERSIWISPSFIRLTSKLLRGTVGQSWMNRNDREYLFGKKGRSASTCAWRRSAISEFAIFMCLSASSSLLGIAKAFDSVDHEHLVRQAARHGYDMNLLRFLLALYCMQRTIIVDGVSNEAVRATRNIVPGDSNADTIMLLCMLSAFDGIVLKFPPLLPAMLADDVQLRITGTDEECAAILSDATEELIHVLENVCKLTVSTDNWSLFHPRPKSPIWFAVDPSV